jgi:tetratricopeptide (TPR) repeat protein
MARRESGRSRLDISQVRRISFSSDQVGQSEVAMICGRRFWDAMRAAALALLLSSICQTPTLAANAIDTLAAQMSEASVNGREQEGLAIAQKLEGLVRRQQGTDNMNYAGVLHNEGMFLNNLGRYQEAADKLNAALAIKLRNRDAASIMRTSNILVNALMILQRRDEALAVGKQSLAIGTSAFGADDPRLAGAIESMGALAREQENYKEAEDISSARSTSSKRRRTCRRWKSHPRWTISATSTAWKAGSPMARNGYSRA